jgi:hypothetical protein
MNCHFEPIKYIATFEVEISSRSELLEFLKVVGYNNKWNKALGETLLDHLGIETPKEVVEFKMELTKKSKKEEKRYDDMPF